MGKKKKLTSVGAWVSVQIRVTDSEAAAIESVVGSVLRQYPATSRAPLVRRALLLGIEALGRDPATAMRAEAAAS